MDIESRIERIPFSGCWIWMGTMGGKGYGTYYFDYPKYRIAHRVVYEMYKGEIPPGLVLDHLCRVKCCVNPDHLEAVPNRTNVLRGIGPTAKNAFKTHCKHGHEFTPQNTRIRYSTDAERHRVCLACVKAQIIRDQKSGRRRIKPIDALPQEGKS